MTPSDTEGQKPESKREMSLPLFWPVLAAARLAQREFELYTRNLKFLAEADKIDHRLRPALAGENTVRLELRSLTLRDYSAAGSKAPPTLVIAPYAGHSAMIADFHAGQSLMQTLREEGVDRLFLTDWASATPDMKDLEIDNYLADLVVCLDDIATEAGGPITLIGLCQGGWMATMLAARFPSKVRSLVLAGAPIDTDAGDGPVKRMAHTIPAASYQRLVAAGGGLMRGSLMLTGWKSMHPEQHYFRRYVDLFEHIDDPAYLAKEEVFSSWYENPIDLPGRWYLQAIVQLFKENRLARGQFVALGRTLDLKDVTCPAYLLAGASDDITTREQVFAARDLFGTPKADIATALVPGGHIGLFMGSHTLRERWPGIAGWILENGATSRHHAAARGT